MSPCPVTVPPLRTVSRCRRGILLALLLSTMAVASADGITEAAVAVLLREQRAWLAEQALGPAPALPEVGVESQAALRRRCFPEFPAPPGTPIQAAYDPAEGRIYLDAALALEQRRDQSYLLHELVHHFQVHGVRFGGLEANGVAPPETGPRSRGRLEGEAYRLQLRWLEHVGVTDPFQALGLDEGTLRLIERSQR